MTPIIRPTVVCILASLAQAVVGEWKAVAPGLELGAFPAGASCAVGDCRMTILRADPVLWDLAYAGIGQTGDSAGLTARQWCTKRKLTAAINAGMFAQDYSTHIGYARYDNHVLTAHVGDYKSMAVFGPRRTQLPRFRIFDLDDPGITVDSILRDYSSAVQNLRLIRRPGANQWQQQGKKWSEAALGEDSSGRILLIVCRSPMTMHDFNERLLALGIGVMCAQHLEGGPEAQLYLSAGGTELEIFGSYETSFSENNGNTAAWPVPNVLGLRPRTASKQ